MKDIFYKIVGAVGIAVVATIAGAITARDVVRSYQKSPLKTKDIFQLWKKGVAQRKAMK